MDDSNRTYTDPQPGDGDDDEVTRLLRLAGPRPRLSESEVAPLRAEAREVFRRQSRSMGRAAGRRRLAWTVGASLAASLLLLVAGWLFRPTAPGAGLPVAQLEMRTGQVLLSRSGLSRSGALVSGTLVTTGESGRAAVRLASGASVRIDGNSSVRIDSAQALTLEQGALYADSGSPATPRSPATDKGIEIATAFGSVRDIGTQFEVRLLAEGALRVRVREGKVLVDHAGRVHETRAGNELLLHEDGSFRQADVPVYGPGWDWVQHTAPPFTIENASLTDFLNWVSRETGLRWHLAEPDAGAAPEHVILHGSIAGLTPEEALSVVLPGCGYRHRLVGGEIWLEKAAR